MNGMHTLMCYCDMTSDEARNQLGISGFEKKKRLNTEMLGQIRYKNKK